MAPISSGMPPCSSSSSMSDNLSEVFRDARAPSRRSDSGCSMDGSTPSAAAAPVRRASSSRHRSRNSLKHERPSGACQPRACSAASWFARTSAMHESMYARGANGASCKQLRRSATPPRSTKRAILGAHGATADHKQLTVAITSRLSAMAGPRGIR
eukprot:scaffold121957_cov28-Tisochrysis_lutea.AAC.6